MTDSQQKTRKRFIAGAICPECQSEDRIFVYVSDDDGVEKDIRECLECGFNEARAQRKPDLSIAVKTID